MTVFKLTKALLCLGMCNFAFSEIENLENKDSNSTACSVLGNICPDARYVTHTVLETTTSSIKLKLETSQNLPLRLSYYPSANPSLIQYGGCEPTLNYGANGNEHIQTVSGLTALTEYMIVVQTSQDIGNTSADCPIMTWEDISCPIPIFTLPIGQNGCTNGSATEVIGLPYVAWSLNNQRMQNNMTKVAWSFKAERTETFIDLVLNHRVGTNYSLGNGGLLKYKFYSGTLPNPGPLIFETGNIVGHPSLYGSRPANTVQPSRPVGNAGFQPFPIQFPVVEGQFYTIVVERIGSAANHISINGHIVMDENREFLYPDLGILDPIEWKIYGQAAGASNWVKRTNNIAIFSLGRTDGTSFGNPYIEELAAPQPDRMYNLTGADRYRWNLNLQTSMAVEKMGMALIRRSGTEPVIMDIKDANGTILETNTFDFSNFPIPGPNNTNLAENDWLNRHARLVNLNVNICLPPGQLYFEVRTGNNTNFEIVGGRDGSDSNFYLPANIDNGFMEISTNSGNTWTKPQQWSNMNVDIIQPAIYLYGKYCSTANCQPICYSNAGTGNGVVICDTLATSSMDLFTELTGNPQTTGAWTDLDNTNALTGSSLDLSALAVGVYRFKYRVANQGCVADSTEVIVEIESCIPPPCALFTPQIDGVQEMGWNTIATNNISNNIVGTVTGTTDLSGYYKIHWDATNLYILVEVTDDLLVNDHSSSFVQDDGVSIYLDGGNEKVTTYDANDHNFTFRWNDPNIRHGAQLNPQGATRVETATSNGYLMEISLSWNLIGVPPVAGSSIGIDVHINDDDDGGNRDKKLTWFGLVDQAFYNPSVLGTYLLPAPCATRQVSSTISLFLEGPFDQTTSTMTSNLLQSNLLPAGQPYSVAPWNYPGLEGTGWSSADYPSGAVDWVLVSLRTLPAASSEITRFAAVLLEDGTTSALGTFELSSVITSAYVVVEHRNHLPAMSATPVDIVNNMISYDFRNQNAYTGANGSGFGQIQINGNWALYTGNADQTNLLGYEITGADRILWQIQNGNFGIYDPTDFNFDGDISGNDRLIWSTNNGISSSIPR